MTFCDYNLGVSDSSSRAYRKALFDFYKLLATIGKVFTSVKRENQNPPSRKQTNAQTPSQTPLDHLITPTRQ